MRSQAGSTAKTATLLMFIIAGAIAAYLGLKNKQAIEPAGGRGAQFQPHNENLRAELQRLPTQQPFTVTAVDEAAALTNVTVSHTASACDAMLLQQLYLTCVTHRTEKHHDGNCRVALEYQGGQCAQ